MNGCLGAWVHAQILGDGEFGLRAVHLLGWWEAGLSRGVLSGGLGLVEGHTVRHVGVLLLHGLLRLVNIWALLLLLLLRVGLGRSCHGISLGQSVRLLGSLLLVRCVVLLHGRLRGLLVLLLLLLLRSLLMLLRLLLLLLRNAVLWRVLLRLLLIHGRSLLLLLLHIVLRELLLRLSGALRSSLLLRLLLLLRTSLLLLLLWRHLLLLLHGCAYLRCLYLLLLLLLSELRRRGRLLLLLLLHFDVTLAHISLRLL